MGENSFSEKLDVEDDGDVCPPHPKNDPSLEFPGDFCGDLLLTVVLVSVDSLELVRDIALGKFSLCGGVGLLEKMDIVADVGTLDVESLNHGPVESEAVVRGDWVLNHSCFSKETPDCGVSDGTNRFGFLGIMVWEFLMPSGEMWDSEVKAAGCLFEVLVVNKQKKFQ